MDPADPMVSAVVTLNRHDGQSIAIGRAGFIKQKFSGLGFEVHAPFTDNFSIGGKQSLFERVFGRNLKVDEEGLGAMVTTEDGGRELPTDVLPDDLRADVASVAFIEPPDFPAFR